MKREGRGVESGGSRKEFVKRGLGALACGMGFGTVLSEADAKERLMGRIRRPQGTVERGAGRS